MNPLGNGGGLPPQVMNSIRQVKGLMQMANGNPMALLQNSNNPIAKQIAEIMQMKNPNQAFINKAKEMGIDPEAIIRELQN